jgi:hypothetical protein
MMKRTYLLALSLWIIACKEEDVENSCQGVTDIDDPCSLPRRPFLWIEDVSASTAIKVSDDVGGKAFATYCVYMCAQTVTASVSGVAFYMLTLDAGNKASLDTGFLLADNSSLFRNCLLRDHRGEEVLGPAQFDPAYATELEGWVLLSAGANTAVISAEAPLELTLEMDVGAIADESVQKFSLGIVDFRIAQKVPTEFDFFIVEKLNARLPVHIIRVVSE